jgi:hypothetical protein
MQAFNEELASMKEAGWLDRIGKGIEDLTRGGNFVGGVPKGGPADSFVKWQKDEAAKAARKAMIAKAPKAVGSAISKP